VECCQNDGTISLAPGAQCAARISTDSMQLEAAVAASRSLLRSLRRFRHGGCITIEYCSVCQRNRAEINIIMLFDQRITKICKSTNKHCSFTWPQSLRIQSVCASPDEPTCVTCNLHINYLDAGGGLVKPDGLDTLDGRDELDLLVRLATNDPLTSFSNGELSRTTPAGSFVKSRTSTLRRHKVQV
jgi:hypothetical protein